MFSQDSGRSLQEDEEVVRKSDLPLLHFCINFLLRWGQVHVGGNRNKQEQHDSAFTRSLQVMRVQPHHTAAALRTAMFAQGLLHVLPYQLIVTQQSSPGAAEG